MTGSVTVPSWHDWLGHGDCLLPCEAHLAHADIYVEGPPA